MERFAYFRGFILCGVNADGSIPLNAKFVAEVPTGPDSAAGVRRVVHQANHALELRAALEELVRPHGSNIQTMRAHAILQQIADEESSV